jgi:hypothetical protein
MAVNDGGAPRPRRVRRSRYRLPKSFRTEAAAPRPAKPRPYRVRAPKRQPGPFRAAERRRVERFNRPAKPRPYRAPKRQPGPFRAAERRRVERFKRTAEYREALAAARRSRPPGRLRYKPGFVPPKQKKGGFLDALKASLFGTPGGTLSASGGLEVVEKAGGGAGSAALSALEQVERPIYGIAGGARAAVRGENVPKAALRGLELKDKYLFPDVLKEAGVKNKLVRTVLGTAADIGFDPTTYLTFGVGPVAKAGAKGAKAAAGAKGAKAAASASRGVKVGVRARVPFTDKVFERQTSGRVSAAAGRRVKRVAARAAESKPGRVVREAHRTVSPRAVPEYRTPAQHAKILRAEREFRAAAALAEKHAGMKARALGAAVRKKGEQKAVQDVVERAPRDVERHLRDLQTFQRASLAERALEKRLAKVRRKERRALRGASRPVRTRELVAAENAYRRAVAARAKLERKLRPKEGAAAEAAAARLRDARERVRRAEAELERVRRATPTVTPKQADRILRVRAQSAKLERELARARQGREGAARGLRENRVSASDLPEGLRRVPDALRREFDRMYGEVERRGLAAGRFRPVGPEDAGGYFPHIASFEFQRKTGRPGYGGKTKVGRERAREIRKPLRVLERETPHLFERDLPRVFAAKAHDVAHRAALHDLWQKVAATGRPFKPNAEITLGTGEHVYEVTPQGLTKIADPRTGGPDLRELRRIVSGERKGKFTILNERSVEAVERNLRGMLPLGEQSIFGRGFDRVTAGLKTLTTIATPFSYQVRNLLGDTFLAALADAGAKDFYQSLKAGVTNYARNRKLADPAQFTAHMDREASRALKRTIKIRGRNVPIVQLLEEAEKRGVIDSGQVMKEFTEQLGGETTRSGKLTRPIRRFNAYRENLGRFAAFISALKRGKSLDEAADWSLAHLIDYGELTAFERNTLRRVFPFYTFWARNTKIQLWKLFARPGKYATVAKLLDEAARAVGFKDYEDYYADLPDYKQRGVPIPVRVSGRLYDAFVSPPITDLNQLTLDGDQWVQNIGGRLHFFKILPELILNRSIFFEGPIDKGPNQHLVPAPDWVVSLPKPLRDALGIATFQDRRSGKRVWGWPAKLDYAARFLPQTGTLVGATTSVRGSRGQSSGNQLVGFFTGIKVSPNRPLDDRIRELYDVLDDLETKLGRLQQRLGKDKSGRYLETAETRRLKSQIKKVNAQIGALRVKRGDVRSSLSAQQRSAVEAPGRGNPYGPPSSSVYNPYGAPLSGYNPYGPAR